MKHCVEHHLKAFQRLDMSLVRDRSAYCRVATRGHNIDSHPKTIRLHNTVRYSKPWLMQHDNVTEENYARAPLPTLCRLLKIRQTPAGQTIGSPSVLATTPFSSNSAPIVTPFSNTLSQPFSLKLDRNNFPLWKTMVNTIIRGHRLEGFINGTQPAPVEFIRTGPIVEDASGSGFIHLPALGSRFGSTSGCSRPKHSIIITPTTNIVTINVFILTLK
ncbi:hypothetical protein F8388_019191 [Cannabis sativa]|uniref:Retrotransposon Copia-like N-terminal domain-containing protein n=1 Tax=Cannabis sativa TaxID=3483 RepID=A0A7J6F5G3_CANSA|nr:hypothetical protein F8388_019191 [Cannabis sativa]